MERQLLSLFYSFTVRYKQLDFCCQLPHPKPTLDAVASFNAAEVLEQLKVWSCSIRRTAEVPELSPAEFIF